MVRIHLEGPIKGEVMVFESDDDLVKKDMERAVALRLLVVQAVAVPPLLPSNYVACLMAFVDLYASMKWAIKLASEGKDVNVEDKEGIHAFINSKEFKDEMLNFISTFIYGTEAIDSHILEIPRPS